MRNKNNSGQRNGDDPCGKDRDLLCDYKTYLVDKALELGGAADAAVINKNTLVSSRNNKVCCVLKAEETVKIYRNIDYYVAIDAGCKTEQIEKNVGDLIKKSEDLGKAVNEAVKSIKTIKDKAIELKAKACDLDTQMKDRCNNQQLNILNAHFKDKCQVDNPEEGKGYFGDFSEIADFIGKKTGEVWGQADSAFNDAVSIAGIQTFSNVKSLKELSKTLALLVKDFKKNIDDNVKSSADELKKAQDELSKCVKEVSTKEMEEHKSTTVYEGTAFTLEFACEPYCDHDENISEICCKVMKTLCKDAECGEQKDDKKSYDWRQKNMD